jgi:hypothetical protein
LRNHRLKSWPVCGYTILTSVGFGKWKAANIKRETRISWQASGFILWNLLSIYIYAGRQISCAMALTKTLARRRQIAAPHASFPSWTSLEVSSTKSSL